MSITSDVHFAAAIDLHTGPTTCDAAGNSDGTTSATNGGDMTMPLSEFVIGPVRAGAFNPVGLDDTFGPEYVFSKLIIGESQCVS